MKFTICWKSTHKTVAPNNKSPTTKIKTIISRTHNTCRIVVETGPPSLVKKTLCLVTMPPIKTISPPTVLLHSLLPKTTSHKSIKFMPVRTNSSRKTRNRVKICSISTSSYSNNPKTNNNSKIFTNSLSKTKSRCP